MRNLFAFLLLLFLAAAYAQETSSDIPYRIETLDGSVFIGTITERTETHLTLRTQSAGELKIAFADVLTMTMTSDEKTDLNSIPQNTRYLFGPNGYGLKKGENYYQNAWIFLNHFTYGITDHFALGAGFMPVFMLGSESIPIWVSPKVSIPVIQDKINVGVGSLNGVLLGWTDSGFGMVYGHVTVGSRHTNFSVGIGQGYLENDWAESIAYSVSGLLKVGRRAYVLTENYMVGGAGVYSIGGRHMVNRLSIDYGLLATSDNFSFIGIPWLGISVPFHTPKPK